MKKTLILCLIAAISFTCLLGQNKTDSPWNIYAELDMYMGYKMGVKYEINHKLDLVSGFGVNAIFPAQKSYSIFASYRSMSYDKLDIAVNFGIMQGVFDYTSSNEDTYFIFSPGLTMQCSYRLSDIVSIGAQGGMVLMVGYEDELWRTSLEPYAGITFLFSEE